MTRSPSCFQSPGRALRHPLRAAVLLGAAASATGVALAEAPKCPPYNCPYTPPLIGPGDDWEEYASLAALAVATGNGQPATPADGTVLTRVHDATGGQGAVRDFRLEVWVQDLDDAAVGWAGAFLLTDPRFVFSCNRASTLLTSGDPACWQASVASWIAAPVLPEGGLADGNPQHLDQVALRPATGVATELGSVESGPWRVPAGSPFEGLGASWIWASADPLTPARPGAAGRPFALFSAGVTGVPEPGSALLAGLGLVAAALASRRGLRRG